MADILTSSGVKAALAAACDAIVAAQDRLTKADQAIGDGDHGVGMARGFRAAREALEGQAEASPGESFRAVGMAVLGKSGGASGAIFGTFFIGAGKALAAATLDAGGYAGALSAGLDAVKARGKAEAGQKTMIDALEPAARAATDAAGLGLATAARAAAEAALSGADATRGMVARFGKAKALGERSLGSPDPGALSMSILLDAIAGSIETI